MYICRTGDCCGNYGDFEWRYDDRAAIRVIGRVMYKNL